MHFLISNFTYLWCKTAIKHLPEHPFNALVFPVLRDCLRSVHFPLSIDRSKAILLFWFLLFYILVLSFCAVMYILIYLVKFI